MNFPNGIPIRYSQSFNGNVYDFKNECISVIIPIRGIFFEKQIQICIQALRHHNNIKQEIIVVEEDHIPKYKFLERYGVKYIFLETNKAFNKSKCFNCGVSNSKYDNISGIDCDMITPINFLGNGAICLKEYDAVFIADDILYSDKYPNTPNEFYWNKKKWKNNQNWQFHGGSFFIKKDKYWDIGGFNEQYEGYGSEDSDFTMRCKRALKVCPKKGMPLLHMKHDKPYATSWLKNQNIYLNNKNKKIDQWIKEVRYHNTFLDETN